MTEQRIEDVPTETLIAWLNERPGGPLHDRDEATLAEAARRLAALTAERDRLATDRAVLLAVVKEINVAHSETVSRTGYTPAGVLPSVKQACKGCGGHYMPPCIEKQATDEALAAVSGTGQLGASERTSNTRPADLNVGTGQPEPQRELDTCLCGHRSFDHAILGARLCRRCECESLNVAAAPVVAVPGQPREDEQLSAAQAIVAAAEDARGSKAEPVCSICRMIEGYLHHSDPNAKGYHPFSPGGR